MTIDQATDILAGQLLRQIDATAGQAGGWNQDAAYYLNAYKSANAGVNVGVDQWGNAVPLFGTAAGYQRSDSTIFSGTPQTTKPPEAINTSSVMGYFKGIGSGIADTAGHPIDTLINAATGLYKTVTDPQGAANYGQANARNILDQAAQANFKPAGQQVGEQIGGTAVGVATGIGVSTAIGKVGATISNVSAGNAAANDASNFINGEKMEGNFYRDGSIVDIAEHFGQFKNGASLLAPADSFGKYPNVGRSDGLFVTTPNYIADLLKQTGGDNTLIKNSLGIEPQYWNGPLIRIDVPNPLNNNPRLPSGLEGGANSQFIRGGYTSGRAPEIVINPISVGSVVKLPVIKGNGK
ncbi:hypothetical protein ACO0LB_19645 [Undibacterium sp. SXout7W]|uniref:hypothetical protein n=1 Tax=Undibacterium sp. SXout7W TaxID=3413049 RepID=UPI003BF06E9A